MSVGSRFRERKTPAPAGNRITLGVFHLVLDEPPSEKGRILSESTLMSTSDTTPLLIERTWDRTNPGPPYLTGGSFVSVKASLPHHDLKAYGTYRGDPSSWSHTPTWKGHWKYVGGFGSPNFNADTYTLSTYVDIGLDQSVVSPWFPSMTTLGSQAYAKLRPQIPKAGLGIMLAEARDLPRMMQTTSRGFHDLWSSMGGSSSSKSMLPKKTANHFLNAQFGWVPFLGDISSMYDVYNNSGKYLRQLAKDNNTWVRRLRTEKIIESEQVLSTFPNLRVNPGPLGTNWLTVFTDATSKLILRTSTQVWYEGAFKYYRPEFDGSQEWSNSKLGDLSRLTTLLGARINPSLIYRATPWTWLIDWFTNVGDTVQRASDWAADGMVSKYMYLMRRQTREVVLQQTIHSKSAGVITMEWTRNAVVKHRVPASSPYGFSLSGSDLSPRQLAILGALGISRS